MPWLPSWPNRSNLFSTSFVYGIVENFFSDGIDRNVSGVVHCKFSSRKLATSIFSRNMLRKKWSNEEFPVLEMEIFLVGDQLPPDLFLSSIRALFKIPFCILGMFYAQNDYFLYNNLVFFFSLEF